jgi:hypothetical protein
LTESQSPNPETGPEGLCRVGFVFDGCDEFAKARSRFRTFSVMSSTMVCSSSSESSRVSIVGAGSLPEVKVSSGKDGTLLQDFFPFAPCFRGSHGAVRDLAHDGQAGLIADAGAAFIGGRCGTTQELIRAHR